MNLLVNYRQSPIFLMINFFITTLTIILIATPMQVDANRLPDNVIELVGYNHNSNVRNRHNQLNNNNNRLRMARQQQHFLQNNPIPLQNLNNKQRADIETVKKNIAEYNNLIKMDTKKLSAQQKVMIEKIVERVARLKEDIIKKISDDKTNNQNDNDSDNNDEVETSRMSSPDFYDSTAASTIQLNNDNNNYNDNIDGTTNQSIDSSSNEDDHVNANYNNRDKFDVKFVSDQVTDDLPQQEVTDTTFIPTNDDENNNQNASGGGGADGTNVDYIDNSTIEPKEPVTIEFNTGSTGGITQQFYTTQNAEARSNQAATITNAGITNTAAVTGTTKSKTRNSSTKKPTTSNSSSKPTAKRISSTHHYHHRQSSSSSPSHSSSSIKSTLIVPSISTTAAAATTLLNNNNNNNNNMDQTSATNNDDYQTTITTVPIKQSQSNYKQQQQQQQNIDQDAANSILINQKQQQILHDQLLQQHQQQLKESTNAMNNGGGGINNLSDLNEKLSNEHHIQPAGNIAGGNPNIQIQERTPLGGAGYISSELIYNPNGTTSTLIDSLSTQSREDYYNLNKQGSGSPIVSSYTGGDINKDLNKKTSGTAKPTKYHYYPHNQHIYLLPECAIQQVCNAVYVRLNYTQPLCACPSRYRDPCSASLNEDDNHTTKLVGDSKKKAITLAKTCEATTEMRECRSPKDWSLLALQNTRTGKSHYLVICRCPDLFKLGSKWSRTIYSYQKAAVLLMLQPNELKDSDYKTIEALMKTAPNYKQRIAGKSLPMEKFICKKCDRYFAQNKSLVLPAIELMYVWNIFKVTGKKFDIANQLLKIIERKLKELEENSHSDPYAADNKALTLLLKGSCLRYMKSPLQAIKCLEKVISLNKSIKEDTYLVPYAIVEIGLIYAEQGQKESAIACMEDVKKNYTGYSLESRLHFRIHAALTELKGKTNEYINPLQD